AAGRSQVARAGTGQRRSRGRVGVPARRCDGYPRSRERVAGTIRWSVRGRARSAGERRPDAGRIRAGEWEFRPEDVTVTREVASEWLVQSDGPYVVALDPQVSADLMQEGLAREVVNRVQRLRKEAGYDYTTRIELSVAGAEDVVAATRAFQGFVEGEVLARRL